MDWNWQIGQFSTEEKMLATRHSLISPKMHQNDRICLRRLYKTFKEQKRNSYLNFQKTDKDSFQSFSWNQHNVDFHIQESSTWKRFMDINLIIWNISKNIFSIFIFILDKKSSNKTRIGQTIFNIMI